MKTRWITMALALAAALPAGAQAEPAKAADAKPLRVLLTYGGHGFEQAPFFAMWDALPGVTYRKAPLPESADLLKPGLEADFDAIALYDMNRALTPVQQQAFAALLAKGIGVVAMHHNIAANSGWDEYRKIIGGKWFAKPEKIDGQTYGPSTYAEGQEFRVTIADPAHPILRGLAAFDIKDEVYGHYYVAPDVHVLLQTTHPKSDANIAWTTQYGKSRVLYLMLGHGASAWNNPSYRQILTQGLRWTAGRE